MSINYCNTSEYTHLESFTKDSTTNKVLKEDIGQAIQLYNNAKFYLQAAELQGALVSYSCAAILLDSIRRNLENLSESKSTPPPLERGVSSVTPENSPRQSDTQDTQESGITDQDSVDTTYLSTDEINNPALKECEKMLNCSLNAVEELQNKVKSLGGSSNKKDDEEEKDWDKICVKHNPLTFKKGSANCLFYNDVIGLNKEKKMIESSLIYPLVYPNLYPKASKGILIYGPPGTGKTYIVKAAVNELQIIDPNVGVLFFAPSPGDLKGKYVGETEKRIEEVFHCASDAACRYETTDCVETKKKYISIIFMDEMDAIGPNRDRDTTGLAANSVNTLLQMMDGINSFQNVCVVAATNYPWNLDDAILRRFDTQVLVDVPSENDLFNLMKYDMKNYIKLEADKTKFSYCEGKTGDKKEENKKTLCQLECERKTVIDLYNTPPYDKVKIDFFEEIKEKQNIISAIADNLKAINFSNSDLSRLMKAAGTNAGELAIQSNLFYSTKLIDDYNTDKFISCLARFRDENVGIEKSIEIIASFLNNNDLGDDFYQAKKPKYAYIIGANNYCYVNIKCLLYKNNTIILNDPMLNNIYIKFCPLKELPNLKNGNWMKDKKENWRNLYKKNILGYATKREVTNPMDIKEADFYVEKTVLDTLDIIITSNLNFIQTSGQTTSAILLPKSTDLITSVLEPIYNLYKNIDTKYKQFNESIQGSGNTWLATNYEINMQGEQTLDTPIYNITQDNKADINFLSDNLKKIIKKGDDIKANILVKKYFTDIRFHNLDFYNYLLLESITDQNEEAGGRRKLYQDYENIFSPVEGKKDITSISIQSINITEPNNSINSLINTGKITYITLTKKSKGIGSDKGSFTETLLYDLTEPQDPKYLISVDEFEGLIENKDIYKSLNYNNTNTLPNPNLLSSIDGPDSTPERGDAAADAAAASAASAASAAAPAAAEPNTKNYLSISKEFFEIIFKDTFEIKSGFFDPYTLTNVEFCNSEIQKMTQLYINDVINLFNFNKKSGFNSDFDSEKLLKMYLNMLCITPDNVGNDNDTIIINNIALRVYDNFKLSSDITKQEYYILGQKQENPQLEQQLGQEDPPVVDIANFLNDPNANSSTIRRRRTDTGRTGGKGNKKNKYLTNKSLKSKNYYEKRRKPKNKTFKSNITYGGVKTEILSDMLEEDLTENDLNNNINSNITYGGVKTIEASDMPGSDEYKRFIIFCISNVYKPQTSNNMIDKEIFLETKFDLKELKVIVRTGGFVDLFNVTYNGFKYLSDSFKGLWESGAKALEKEKADSFLQNLNNIKEKKQYVARLFKEIYAIGFLIDTEGMTRSLGEVELTREELGKKGTIEDSNIKSASIMWAKCDKLGNIIKTQYKAFLTICQVPAVNAFIISSTAVSAVLSALWTGLSASSYTFSAYFILQLLMQIRESLSGEVVAEDIIDNIFFSQLYTLIFDVGFLNVETFESNPIQLLVESIEENYKNSYNWLMRFIPGARGRQSIAGDDKIIKSKINTLNNPLSMYLFVSDEILAQGWLSNEGLGQDENGNPVKFTDVYTVINYNDNPDTRSDIKNKLKNINIPLSSFYYALSVVKSTYNPETGKMLKEYYADKAKFMKDYEAKLKKQN